MDVIMANEKWGERIVRAEDGTVESAALELLSERLDLGFYYDGEAEGRAAAIVAGDDREAAGVAAWKFLLSRKDHEYEYVEVRWI
jgi:hypothetical protein